MIIRDDEPSGIVDRLFGALVAFFFSMLTFFLAPIFVVANYWEKGQMIKYMGARFMLNKLLHTPFFVWILMVSIIALFYGAYSGTIRTITTLSHLWGTSNDAEMTSRLWAIFAIGFINSLYLMF